MSSGVMFVMRVLQAENGFVVTTMRNEAELGCTYVCSGVDGIASIATQLVAAELLDQQDMAQKRAESAAKAVSSPIKKSAPIPTFDTTLP